MDGLIADFKHIGLYVLQSYFFYYVYSSLAYYFFRLRAFTVIELFVPASRLGSISIALCHRIVYTPVIYSIW